MADHAAAPLKVPATLRCMLSLTAMLLATCTVLADGTGHLPSGVSPGDEAAAKTELQRLFAADIATAERSQDNVEVGRLAARIFVTAKQRSNESAFVAVALDEVVRLALRSPKHQDLAYAALRTQKESGLRPAELNLTKMASLVPAVLRAMDGPSQRQWLERVAIGDTMELARLHVGSGKYADAMRTVESIEKAMQAQALPVPESVSNNVRGLRLLSQSLEGVTSRPSGETALYRAVLLMMQKGDQDEILRLLRACGAEAAGKLAEAMQTTAAGDDRASAMRLLSAASQMKLPSLIEAPLIDALAAQYGARVERVTDQYFFGVPLHSTKKVVFVIDCSGSMGPRLGRTVDELKKAVQMLRSDQSFQIIFFNTTAMEMPGGIKVATAANKALALEFIDRCRAGGGTNPTEALERAFALQTETIHILTDGEFQASVVETIDKLNVGRKVIVNTIAIMAGSGSMERLREIASRNGGTFKAAD